VTGAASRSRVHRLRDQVDAILVGAGTVAADDPRLTARLPRGGKNPVRVVLDSALRLPLARRVFSRQARTLVATHAKTASAQARALTARGVEVWTFPGQGPVPLARLLPRLASAGLQHVLVEGGAQVHASFVKAGLADELWLFLAPKLLGAEGRSWVGPLSTRLMGQARQVSIESIERLEGDLLVRARF